MNNFNGFGSAIKKAKGAVGSFNKGKRPQASEGQNTKYLIEKDSLDESETANFSQPLRPEEEILNQQNA